MQSLFRLSGMYAFASLKLRLPEQQFLQPEQKKNKKKTRKKNHNLNNIYYYYKFNTYNAHEFISIS